MNITKEQMLEWLDTATGEYDYATEERTREAIRSLIESSGEKAPLPADDCSHKCGCDECRRAGREYHPN